MFKVVIIALSLSAFSSSRDTLLWTDYHESNEDNIRRLITILESSKEGKRVLNLAYKKAENYGKSIYDVIKVGDGSVTDTTLLRRFNPNNPLDVAYDSRALVYINKHLRTYHAVLDLSHELIHYVYRKDFNPYERNFSLSGFIKNTIEGSGGEAEAYLSECKVNLELYNLNNSEQNRCREIFKSNNVGQQKKLAIKKFYQLGDYFKRFKDSVLKVDPHVNLDAEFPHISDTQVSFHSSAYSKPYPIASIEEFVTISQSACQNESRRLELASRNLAAETKQKKLLFSLKNDFESKCNSFIQ